MVNISKVGDGKVVLIAGGGKCYTDIAARFCYSERSIEEIVSSDYDQQLVKNIVNSGHLAATEFDYYIFGIEGYARVTEIQLVRKRLASYLIKSGRNEMNGKRNYDVVIPESIMDLSVPIPINGANIYIDKECTIPTGLTGQVYTKVDTSMVLDILEEWYTEGLVQEIPEEDLRYMKPQATAFRAIIGMDAHALMDWFKIRTCMKAQTEIRDLAIRMLNICKDSNGELFKDAGPSCKGLGYCPENKRQHPSCTVIRKSEAMKVLKDYQASLLTNSPKVLLK